MNDPPIKRKRKATQMQRLIFNLPAGLLQRVDSYLARLERFKGLRINRSQFIREAIAERLEQELRRLGE